MKPATRTADGRVRLELRAHLPPEDGALMESTRSEFEDRHMHIQLLDR